MLFVFALICSLVATNAYYDDYDSYEGVGKLSLRYKSFHVPDYETTKIPLEKKHCHQQTFDNSLIVVTTSRDGKTRIS